MSWLDDPENYGNVPKDLAGIYDEYGRYIGDEKPNPLAEAITRDALKTVGAKTKIDYRFCDENNSSEMSSMFEQ